MISVIRHGTINKYDYGNEDDNNKHYGQPNPPAYDMSSISKDFPLFLSYGGQDYLSDVDDDNYAHLDFVHATNAKEQVYDPLMDFFRSH
ncbi:hypothetical protein Leryth_021428 [Lithospermum erythrorhizon]|nr:hypothetical protein Leryth_021428 [Lithospermum erythrorhizon]